MIIRGETFFQGPFPIGHEFVGEVVDVGDEVASVTPGDRVVVSFQISCGICARCQEGLTAACPTTGGRGMYGFGGVCTNVFPFYTDPEPPFPLFEMFVTGITFLTGRPQVRPIIPEVLKLVRSGRIHPERVTGCVVSWEDAAEALLGPIQKIVMVPG